jgi:hypothetical protein
MGASGCEPGTTPDETCWSICWSGCHALILCSRIKALPGIPISFAGIAGPQRLWLLRQGLVGFFARAAARCGHRGAILRSEPTQGVEFAQKRTLRFPGAEPKLETRRRLDHHHPPAIRQDLRRSRLRQSWPRRHPEFHPGERTRWLADFRRRKSARFSAHVPRPVSKLMSRIRSSPYLTGHRHRRCTSGLL